jgi:hypothetical protein
MPILVQSFKTKNGNGRARKKGHQSLSRNDERKRVNVGSVIPRPPTLLLLPVMTMFWCRDRFDFPQMWFSYDFNDCRKSKRGKNINNLISSQIHFWGLKNLSLFACYIHYDLATYVNKGNILKKISCVPAPVAWVIPTRGFLITCIFHKREKCPTFLQ